MSTSTQGTELMQQIADGRIEQLPSAFLVEARDGISAAIEELIEVGARIRPLYVKQRQIGWVRGVHLTERKALKRWIYNEIDFVSHLLRIGTTLTPEEIQELNIVELRSLSRLVKAMTESDLRLYPYLHAFVSTGISEQLWYSKGTESTAFRDRFVELPDGKRMKVLAAADQAKLWATLCNYRIQTKARLDASFNAVLTIRPWVGKGADPLAHDLKNIARGLQTDSFEPWREVIRTKPEANFEDGWAHSEDDSLEGMKRELDGMSNNDRHERVVTAFYEQLSARAEKRKRQVEERVMQRDTELDEPRPLVVRSAAEVKASFDADRQEREKLKPPIAEEETQSSLAERLAKYK